MKNTSNADVSVFYKSLPKENPLVNCIFHKINLTLTGNLNTIWHLKIKTDENRLSNYIEPLGKFLQNILMKPFQGKAIRLFLSVMEPYKILEKGT